MCTVHSEQLRHLLARLRVEEGGQDTEGTREGGHVEVQVILDALRPASANRRVASAGALRAAMDDGMTLVGGPEHRGGCWVRVR